MPQFDFYCKTCKTLKENVVLNITHSESDRPVCCEATMRVYHTVPPLIHWRDPNIDAFRAIATPDKPIINNTRENRAYMEKHDLILDGDRYDTPPPNKADDIATNAEAQKSIDAITPDASQLKQLVSDGVIDSDHNLL